MQAPARKPQFLHAFLFTSVICEVQVRLEVSVTSRYLYSLTFLQRHIVDDVEERKCCFLVGNRHFDPWQWKNSPL